MSHASLNRREFLKTGGAAGATLVIGLYLPAFDLEPPHAAAAPQPFRPNAWIEIGPDGSVTIWTGRSEMGQGVRTAMPMIVAEELEADWTRVRVAQADADPAYGDQFTVGSRSVRTGFEPLRKAGAAARVMSFDTAPALAVPGVQRVVQISSGVAVVAENTWAAFQGKKALRIEWDEGATARWSSDGIWSAFTAAAVRSGEVVRKVGDVDEGLKGAAQAVDAVYQAPYLAHACMEPMNCTAYVKDGKCEIWAPTQNPQGIQQAAVQLTGLPVEAITVHVTYLGGGFGRRGGPMDYATEAVELAQKTPAPVQVVWTREDDIQNALYRPATYNVLRGGLDARGAPVAWSHRLVGPAGGSFLITRGADELIYPVPHFRLERITEDPGIPVAPWRGVGPSQNGWVVESFVDELAHAAGRDPYEYRRALVADHPRLLGVLDLAAERAGWRTAPPAGRSRGIALWQFGETFLAQVAEVSVGADGAVRVHRVVCTADCGIVVNPDTVQAQIEGAIVYGLTAALYGEITIDHGRVAQSNFTDYRMLALAEMPTVEFTWCGVMRRRAAWAK